MAPKIPLTAWDIGEKMITGGVGLLFFCFGLKSHGLGEVLILLSKYPTWMYIQLTQLMKTSQAPCEHHKLACTYSYHQETVQFGSITARFYGQPVLLWDDQCSMLKLKSCGAKQNRSCWWVLLVIATLKTYGTPSVPSWAPTVTTTKETMKQTWKNQEMDPNIMSRLVNQRHGKHIPAYFLACACALSLHVLYKYTDTCV